VVEVFKATKGQPPLCSNLLKVLKPGGIGVNSGVIVGVKILERGVCANVRADGVCAENPALQ
jgi:hypothetical protein